MNKELSKRQPVGRQQVAPAAFEIRFSATDSQGVEFVEIPPPNLDPQERNIPDPFKKRDKIPRNSGSGLTLESLAQNVSMPPPSRLSGNDAQSTPVISSKQWNSVAQKNKLVKDLNNTSSNGFDASTKAKSWNSVGPEAEKQERKGKLADKMEVDEAAMNLSSMERRNKVNDESTSKQNNKKRPLPVEENGSVKENGFSTKDTSTQNLTHGINKDLYVTAETVVPNNKENMGKNNNKSRKTNMTTEIKDDDIFTVSRPTDGIATPPATPPSSPPIAPQNPQSSSVSVPQATSKTKEIPPLPSPPSPTGSPSRIPRLSPSRPIITAYSLELQEEQEQQEREEQVQQEQEHQQTKSHSRRRPTISHDDMIIPTIAKKLKMNGQLPYPNHDALLGVSDEQDLTPEKDFINATDYIDATNKADDSLEQRLPGRQSSVPELQQRKASLSKALSKTPSGIHQDSDRNRKDIKGVNPRAQVEEASNSVGRAPKSDEDKKRKRKSRREEFVLVIRDEDEVEEFGDISEPRYSMSLTPSEPSMSTTTTLLPSERDSAEHEHDESKSEINSASSSTQSVQHGTNVPNSTVQLTVPNKTSPHLALELERTFTSDPNDKKFKKQKKNKNKKNKETVVDEDDEGYVKKSACCCIIC